jgi:hypothetical protein
MLVRGDICAQLLCVAITLCHLSGLLAHKFMHCLLLRRADSCKLVRIGQGSMISDSTENSCLRIDASGVEDIINDRLHLPTLCIPARQWRAHGAIGIQNPWMSCSGDVCNNRESIGDCGHIGGTVSGGSGGGVGGGGKGGGNGGNGGGGGIGLKVEQTKLLLSIVCLIPTLPLVC